VPGGRAAKRGGKAAVPRTQVPSTGPVCRLCSTARSKNGPPAHRTTGVAGGSCCTPKAKRSLPLFRYGLATRRGGPCSRGDRQTSNHLRDRFSQFQGPQEVMRAHPRGAPAGCAVVCHRRSRRRGLPKLEVGAQRRWQRGGRSCRFLPPSAPCDAHHFGPLDLFNTRSKCNVGSA